MRKGRRGGRSSASDQGSKNIRLLLAPKFADKTKRKIRVILAIGLENGHDSLVLSAFGCGAFCIISFALVGRGRRLKYPSPGNPPGHIAQLFKEVITQEFNGCYKHITFAIYGTISAFDQL